MGADYRLGIGMIARHDANRVLKQRALGAVLCIVLTLAAVVAAGIFALVALLATTPPVGGGR